MRARREALGLLVLPFALAVLTGPPSLDAVTRPAGPLDPTAPIVAALAVVAWAGCGWLLLLAALTAVRLDAVTRWLAPAAVRAVVRVAVGATALSVLAAPAVAQPPAPPPPAAVDLDWPEAPATAHPTPKPPAPASTDVTPAGVFVVQPGDSLWAIAARALGPQPAARRVAAAWPAWWAANRAAIGDDPDLIFPGTALHAPAPTRGEP